MAGRRQTNSLLLHLVALIVLHVTQLHCAGVCPADDVIKCNEDIEEKMNMTANGNAEKCMMKMEIRKIADNCLKTIDLMHCMEKGLEVADLWKQFIQEADDDRCPDMVCDKTNFNAATVDGCIVTLGEQFKDLQTLCKNAEDPSILKAEALGCLAGATSMCPGVMNYWTEEVQTYADELNTETFNAICAANMDIECIVSSAQAIQGGDSPYENASMTHEMCIDRCKLQRYLYAGIQGDNTCLCGASYEGAAATTCDRACAGNANQICGGDNAVRVFDLSHPMDIGCIPSSNRTTFMGSGISMTSDAMTHEKCINQCQDKGTPFASIQGDNVCYCANNYDPQDTVENATCDSACAGNPNQICGGDDAVRVFAVGPKCMNVVGIMEAVAACNNAFDTSAIPIWHFCQNANALLHCLKAATGSCKVLKDHVMGSESILIQRLRTIGCVGRNEVNQNCDLTEWSRCYYDSSDRAVLGPAYYSYKTDRLEMFRTENVAWDSLCKANFLGNIPAIESCNIMHERRCYEYSLKMAKKPLPAPRRVIVPDTDVDGGKEQEEFTDSVPLVLDTLNTRVLTFMKSSYCDISLQSISAACIDNSGGRAMPGSTFIESGMTHEWCVNKCLDQGTNYAGIQGTITCICADKYRDIIATCDKKCPGNLKQICGGEDAIRVFEVDVFLSAQPPCSDFEDSITPLAACIQHPDLVKLAQNIRHNDITSDCESLGRMIQCAVSYAWVCPLQQNALYERLRIVPDLLHAMVKCDIAPSFTTAVCSHENDRVTFFHNNCSRDAITNCATLQQHIDCVTLAADGCDHMLHEYLDNYLVDIMLYSDVLEEDCTLMVDGEELIMNDCYSEDCYEKIVELVPFPTLGNLPNPLMLAKQLIDSKTITCRDGQKLLRDDRKLLTSAIACVNAKAKRTCKVPRKSFSKPAPVSPFMYDLQAMNAALDILCIPATHDCRISSGGQALTGGGMHFEFRLTQEWCINKCLEEGKKYAGIQGGMTCFCGDTLSDEDSPNCTQVCRGNDLQTCGGKKAIRVFETAPAPGACANGGAIAYSALETCVNSVQSYRSLYTTVITSTNPAAVKAACDSLRIWAQCYQTAHNTCPSLQYSVMEPLVNDRLRQAFAACDITVDLIPEPTTPAPTTTTTTTTTTTKRPRKKKPTVSGGASTLDMTSGLLTLAAAIFTMILKD